VISFVVCNGAVKQKFKLQSNRVRSIWQLTAFDLDSKANEVKYCRDLLVVCELIAMRKQIMQWDVCPMKSYSTSVCNSSSSSASVSASPSVADSSSS
jgi:hypothetical protein